MTKIRTAVVGAGKMGGIHAKVLSKLANSELVAIVDSEAERAEKIAAKHKCQHFTDPKELIGKVDAVTISAPTIYHKELAEIFITNGIHVMIEKPLAASLEEGQAIVDLAKKHNVVAAVGHSERCNPVVQAMKRLNIEPKFIEAHRISPYPFRSTDIGVVLDVMIHDIDIILAFANSDVVRTDAVGINVIEENEDICNARIYFANGCVANVTASRIALKTERKIRVFSRQAYLSLDFFKKTGTIIKADPNLNIIEMIREKKKVGALDLLKMKWNDMLHVENLDIDDREPLRVEQESFLAAIGDSDKSPEVTAVEGLKAMNCAKMILESIKEHKWE
jgi:predicted dehydrogenase